MYRNKSKTLLLNKIATGENADSLENEVQWDNLVLPVHVEKLALKGAMDHQ